MHSLNHGAFMQATADARLADVPRHRLPKAPKPPSSRARPSVKGLLATVATRLHHDASPRTVA